MIDLTKKVLPDSVEVSGRTFKIKTDFQYWIRFILLLEEEPLLTDFDYLYDGKIPENRAEGFETLKAFAFPKKELPRSVGPAPEEIPYSFELDSDLIYSAFYSQYGIDLADKNISLHFYKFMALFDGLRECKFSDVVGYRLYQVKGKLTDYDNQMLKLRDAWRIYPKLSKEIQEEMNDFNSLFY